MSLSARASSRQAVARAYCWWHRLLYLFSLSAMAIPARIAGFLDDLPGACYRLLGIMSAYRHCVQGMMLLLVLCLSILPLMQSLPKRDSAP